MDWKVEAKGKAKKFILSQDNDTQDRIRQTVKKLIEFLDNGIFPFNEMDIKKLHGKGEGPSG